jgi:hypothetical protein
MKTPDFANLLAFILRLMKTPDIAQISFHSP